MRTLLGALGLVLSALALAAVAATPAVARDTPAPALERAVDDLVAAGAPGAVLLVRDEGRTLRIARGHADAAKVTPMRAGDRFRAGSVTKTFVATVVLQLAREGRLDLGDPVGRWLPGAVPGGANVTLRHLLNHTSGLFNYSEDPRTFEPYETDPDHRWDPRGLLRIASDHPALFAPGTDWSYSNTTYALLGWSSRRPRDARSPPSCASGSSSPPACGAPRSTTARRSPGATRAGTSSTTPGAGRTSPA